MRQIDLRVHIPARSYNPMARSANNDNYYDQSVRMCMRALRHNRTHMHEGAMRAGRL